MKARWKVYRRWKERKSMAQTENENENEGSEPNVNTDSSAENADDILSTWRRIKSPGFSNIEFMTIY